MRSLCAILLLGCVEEQTGGECREGTYRQKDGHCALDDSEPSATDDTGEPDPEPEPEPEPTDDTGDAPPPDDGGEPWPPTPSWMSLADATITFEGGATGARVGRAAAGAGDVDGDGRADILIGADRANSAGGEERGGWAMLHLSANLPDSGVVAIETADARWVGNDEGELLGHNLGAGGDIDGDGLPDILIAGYHAPAGGHHKGTVYGIFGQNLTMGTHNIDDADWAIDGSRDIEGMGHGMSTAGDVDGDGLSDVVMGGCCSFPPEQGRAWIVTASDILSGPIDLTTHTPRWDGVDIDDQAGYKTSPVGDVDGDGLDDVAIGARLQDAGANRAGKVYIIFGGSMPGVEIGSLADADVHLPGTAIGGEHGYDISPGGDIDGDGLTEVVTGAHQSSRNVVVGGEAMIFFGASMNASDEIPAEEADLRFITYEVNHLLGVSVEGGMDFDGDGGVDLILGASGMAPPTQGSSDEDEFDGMDSPGDAYLYWSDSLVPGVHEVTEADVHFEGEELMDHAGIKVTSAGDVDADGSDDLLIGTERGQNGVGRAYLLLGLRQE